MIEEDFKQQLKIQKKQIEIEKRIDWANIPFRLKKETMESFITSNDQQKEIKDTTIKFLNDYPKNPYKAGLIFTGETCTGKSHLACAILKEMIKQFNLTGRIVEATELFRSLKEGEKESYLLHKLKKLDFLVLELNVKFSDLNLYQTNFIKEIILDRYDNMTPIILTTNLNIPELRSSFGDEVLKKFELGGGKILIFFQRESKNE